MAGIAVIRSVGVIAGFANSSIAVMTAGTRSNHMPMIYCSGLYWCPWRGTRLVTGIAGIGAINMVAGFTGCCRTIMATGTNTQHLIMIYGS